MATNSSSLSFPSANESKIKFCISPDGTYLLVTIPVEVMISLVQKKVQSGSLDVSGFTPREREVFKWLMKGLLAKEIADKTHIAIRTVKSHLGSIYIKSGMTRNNLLRVYGTLDE